MDPWAPPPSTAWTLEDWRNFALIVGAVLIAPIGLVLSAWRSYLMHKQTDVLIQQTAISQKQSDDAKVGQDFDRFQRGASMLGDKRLSVREAGIETLRDLALHNPETYAENVFQRLASFVRERSLEEEHKVKSQQNQSLGEAILISSDAETAIKAISDLRKKGLLPKSKVDLGYTHFRGAKLRGANLSKIDLSGVDLTMADVSQANLSQADLTDAILQGADLEDSNLCQTNLRNAVLWQTRLSEAHLIGASLRGADLKDVNILQPDDIFIGKTLITKKQLRSGKNCPQEYLEADWIPEE